METSVDSALRSAREKLFPRTRDFLARCWRGKASCPEAFWLVLVSGHVALYILSVLFMLALMMVNGVLKSISPGAAEAGAVVGLAVYSLFAIAQFTYSVFALVSVWRCAPNTERKVHSVLARSVVLLIVALVLMVFIGGVQRGMEVIEQRRSGTEAAVSDIDVDRLIDDRAGSSRMA